MSEVYRMVFSRVGSPLQEASRDVPLDGVAFSIELPEWGRKFSDFWSKQGFKMRKWLFIKFSNKLTLTPLFRRLKPHR